MLDQMNDAMVPVQVDQIQRKQYTQGMNTTQIPSSDLRLSFPINPLRRANVVSAAVTLRLRKDSRVWLYTQYFRRSINQAFR